MKISKNDPCPCGSGKMYKNCCYLKDINVGEDSSQGGEDDFYEDDVIEDLIYLRRIVMGRKPHIKEYYRIRKTHSEIINAMITYHREGKFKYETISKNLKGVNFSKSCFDLSTRLGLQSFYDIFIYKTPPNTRCITEDFIQNNRYRKPEKVEFLHSMLNSQLGLFEITGIDTKEGYAYIKEVFTGKEYKIIDIGISNQNNYNIYLSYTRIITYNGISFSSGLNFVFLKTDPFIKNFINEHKKNILPEWEFARFIQLYNYLFDHPEKNLVSPVRFE